MNCRICKRRIPDNSLYCNWCGTYQLAKKTKTVSVPTPKQLPSGAWRIWLDREKKSITAESPDVCTLQATEYRKQWEIDEAAGLHIPPPQVTTLRSVVESYIASREPVRSPSTIEGYRVILNNRFQPYMELNPTSIDFQQMINDEIASGISAKTIRNSWGLINAALRQAKIVTESPSLPRAVKASRSWLDFNEINRFLFAIRGSKYELPALLALHSLRKSELLGLRISDYEASKKLIHVRGALIRTKAGYVYSDLNKTDSSFRDVPIIIPRLAELLDNNINNNILSSQYSSLNPDRFLVEAPRDGIYKAINLVCKQAGLPEIGLHGLRHSFASLAYHLGWKKLSTMQIGGWSNSKVLDEIYTHNADLHSDVETMLTFFMQNSVQNIENSD